MCVAEGVRLRFTLCALVSAPLAHHVQPLASGSSASTTLFDSPACSASDARRPAYIGIASWSVHPWLTARMGCPLPVRRGCLGGDCLSSGVGLVCIATCVGISCRWVLLHVRHSWLSMIEIEMEVSGVVSLAPEQRPINPNRPTLAGVNSMRQYKSRMTQ